jgi:hypothetical protein
VEEYQERVRDFLWFARFDVGMWLGQNFRMICGAGIWY